MMMGSFAKAGIVLGNSSYVQRAIDNANFIEKYLWKDNKILRAVYAGENETVNR